MSYYEMFMLYVGISVPFMLSFFVQGLMLFGKGKVLIPSDDIKDAYKKYLEFGEVLPEGFEWLISFSSTIGLLFMSILKGLLWVVNPWDSLQGMIGVLQWKFKEI